MNVAICEHCGIRRRHQRVLCRHCFDTPGLRDRYPARSDSGRRGVRDFYGRPQLPAEPTAAMPGTIEKVQVLEERARQGVALWHPLDA